MKTGLETALKERVKELKCLYELSRIAWDSNNDLDVILNKLLRILPAAMQHSRAAQCRIHVDGKEYVSPNYSAASAAIQSNIVVDGRKRGSVEVIYKKIATAREKLSFLPEEKKLVKTVSQELSFMIKRSSVEEEKAKIESKLQHVERLAFVGELSAGIAHELNEPLGRILGFAQLIKKGGALNDQQDEDVEKIIKASLLTREIIKKLMLFSRQMPQQLTTVNLNEVIENILYFIDVGYQNQSIKVEARLEESLRPIQADAVQMSQVMVNLITNGIHAMPNGGKLLIRTHEKDNTVVLSVSDTGVGMSREVKKKLFEPFFTTKPIGHGTGLGLSVVHGIVTSHQGKISVKSVEGKGSIFEIVLPIRTKNRKKV
jgi:two-component system, NtrC family, sensor kinase